MTISHNSAKIVFSVHCPALNQDVILTEDAWFGHILHPQTGHKEMKGKKDLIKRVIAGIPDTSCFFRYSDLPKDSWAYDYECPDFKPYNDYLRIAFKRLRSENIILVATAIPIKRGVLKYEP